MTRRHIAWAVGGIGIITATALWIASAPPPGRAQNELAAAPLRAGSDPFGFGERFDRELGRLGQISTARFAEMYATPEYLSQPSWDPTTAKFFDKINARTVVKSYTDWQKKPRQFELPGYELDAEEMALFKKNGFVASERLGYSTFGEAYYNIYARDLPVFVTSDSVLHAWHRSYDAIMEELEEDYFRPALEKILVGMHQQVATAHARYGNGILKDSIRDADYFLAVGRCLLTDKAILTVFDQGTRVEDTLEAVRAGGMETFDLFGRNREMDFSQFKPRGRYNNSQLLQTYFRAMMWCGRIDMRVAGEGSSPRELGSAAVLLDLLRHSGGEADWREFDRLLTVFVGRVDSATFDDLDGALRAAGRTVEGLRAEDDLTGLAEAIASTGVGKQEVRGDLYASPPTGKKLVLPRSFTVMGQRFALDSWAMNGLCFDNIVWDGEKVQRRMTSGLDVAFAALGNSHVVPDIVERIERGPHRWRDGKPYQHNLAATRTVIDGLNAGAWDESVYTGWLAALRTLSEPANASAPGVTRTRAWAMKQTNTQLASWTELRHDTLLYVKPFYGMIESCYYPAGYVEPVVPFWGRMGATASRAADLINSTPFPKKATKLKAKQVKFLRDFAAQMGRIKAVAEKQAGREELSADEQKVLTDVVEIRESHVCGQGPTYSGWYPKLFYREPKDCVKWDALVADVCTDPASPVLGDPGSVLHQGVGDMDMMIIAVKNGKDRVAYAGPTFSHYEFELPNATRKTDDEWKDDLVAGRRPSRPEWTRNYLVPRPGRKSPLERSERDEIRPYPRTETPEKR